MFTSCVSYVQVYKTAPSDKLVLKNNLLVFEDENCKVSYNLWDAGGNVGFQFFNKTDKKVLIGLTMQMGTPSSLPFLQAVGIDSPSTAFSSLKRLGQQGYVIRNEGYELDDPFFRRWIEVKREG